MEESNEKNTQSISWWITSLAISVACCAVLFVIFAGYLGDIKKQIANENEQLAQVALHEEKLLAEILSLQHSVTSGQVPVAPTTVLMPTATPSATIAPVATTPGVPATAVVVEPPALTPVGTTAPAVVTVPAAAPTAIPEVPAK